jgi:hypothetical protein
MDYMIKPSPEPLGSPNADWEDPKWSGANTLDIAQYRWADSGHHPPTKARIVYDDEFIATIFRVEDQWVKAVARNFGDAVSQDSCVEFFLSPYSMDRTNAYFNFEINCGGTLLLRRCSSTTERGWGRGNPMLAEVDADLVRIAHTLPDRIEEEIEDPVTWAVEFHVPFALFARYFIDLPAPSSRAEWKGNLYKCAGGSHPHWGSWAPIELEKPSFHAPEFFQPLRFD